MARERLGWALADVAQRLRIRQAFLIAIEEGRFSALPGHAYALGFVRSYASLLGLSADEVARRFRTEVHDIAARTTLEFPAPVPDRGVPAGAVVFLGCVLSIAAYIGWYRASGEQPTTAIVETVPDRLAPLAMLPPPPLPPPAPVAEIPAPPAPMGLPSYPPTSAGAAMPPPSFSMPPAPEPPTQASDPAVTPANDDAKIVIRARADTWVQIRDKAGQTLLNRVLRPGETYNVPPKQQLLFTTGNAGGVDLVVDGVTAPSLGANGVVRRDLPLDPDAIRNVKAPPVHP
jgi:cytoskeleton protein RodZ